MEDNNFENKEINTTKKTSLNSATLKFIMSIAGIVAVALVIFNLFFNTGTSSRTVVTSILNDQKVVSELSTLIVPYGGIYEEKNDKGKDILSIAYHGSITYGLDFSQLKISADDNNRIITVKIPPIEIKDVYIDPRISSIPEESAKERVNYLQICKEDVLNKFARTKENNKNKASTSNVDQSADNYDEMYDLARTTAIETISSFLSPIIENMGDGYTLVVE